MSAQRPKPALKLHIGYIRATSEIFLNVLDFTAAALLSLVAFL